MSSFTGVGSQSLAHIGAAASATSGGRCEQTYKQCMSDPTGFSLACELAWNACVFNKCKAEDTSLGQQCPKDADCELSCTEAATSKQGLLPGDGANNAEQS